MLIKIAITKNKSHLVGVKVNKKDMIDAALDIIQRDYPQLWSPEKRKSTAMDSLLEHAARLKYRRNNVN